jgi:hypothetical protein
VPVEGIEPPTFGLQNRCSTAELNRPGPPMSGGAFSLAATAGLGQGRSPRKLPCRQTALRCCQTIVRGSANAVDDGGDGCPGVRGRAGVERAEDRASRDPGAGRARDRGLLARASQATGRLHAGPRRPGPPAGGDHPGCSPRQGRQLRDLRQDGDRRGADDQGYDLPDLFPDQAGDRRGDDDPVRGGQMAPRRPGHQVRAGIGQPARSTRVRTRTGPSSPSRRRARRPCARS